MGAWACPSCIEARGLHRTELHGMSSGKLNYCGVGGHQVADVVRWAPGVSSRGQLASKAKPAATGFPQVTTRVLAPGEQGSLF